MQDARAGEARRGNSPHGAEPAPRPGGGWAWVQLGVSIALTLGLAAGLIQFARTAKNLPLEGSTRVMLGALLVLGLLVFMVRSVLLAMRRGAPPVRR